MTGRVVNQLELRIINKIFYIDMLHCTVCSTVAAIGGTPNNVLLHVLYITNKGQMMDFNRLAE
jgi:hypothetical protein